MNAAGATTESDFRQSTAFRSASVYIFLAVTCLVVILALVLSFATMRTLGRQRFPCPLCLKFQLTTSFSAKQKGQSSAYAYGPMDTSSGLAHVSRKYEIFVLLAIPALLLAREAFYGATTHNFAQVSSPSCISIMTSADAAIQQSNEHLWYPLSALTEFIAVALFAVPGVVPAQNELPQEEKQMNVIA